MRRGFYVLACAWILWEEALGITAVGGRGGLKTWEPQKAFESKAACDKALDVVTAAASSDQATRGKKRICLPDTVNPK